MLDRDDENPSQNAGLGDLGDLGALAEGSMLSDVALDAPRLSESLDADIDLAAVPMSELLGGGSTVAPPVSLACNAATHECLRGPCLYLWHWMQAMPAQAEVTAIQRTQACMRHAELQSLVNENVFVCEQWWPGTFGFVPESLRPLMRPKLRQLWEIYLRRVKKLSFQFRWWPQNVFDLSPDEVYTLRQREVRRVRKANKEEAPPKP